MPTIAALFPGQGSHTPGMDEPLRGNELFEHGLELLGEDPFERIAEGTRYQQPALFLCSVCAWDDDPDVVAAAGHSLGEYAALVAGGALEFDDAVRLVAERGAAMAECPPGAMVASLGGDEAAVRALAAELELTIANDNAPGQLVLSGEPGAIDEAVEQLPERARARAMRLDVSGAFHSPLMSGAADRLAAALARVEVREPSFPVYSGGSAQPFADIRRELAENLLRPVRFREVLLALPADEMREYGPGRVLTGLAKRTLREAARS